MQLYDLSDDNINIIIPFLDLKYVFNFCCTNLKNLNHNQSYLKKIIISKKKKIKILFPSIILNLVNGISTLVFAPELKFKKEFIEIDYIDRIKSEDVYEPIMYGSDIYNRPFFTIRTIDDFEASCVFTIFQRYTNDRSIWTHGVYGFSYLNINEVSRIINNSEIKSETLKQNIKHLLNNDGYIIYKNYKNELKKVRLNLI